MDESGFGIEADLIIASILVFSMCAIMVQRTSGLVENAVEELGRESLSLKAIAVSNALLLERDENFSAFGSAWQDRDRKRVVAKTVDPELLARIPESQRQLLGLSRLEVFFGSGHKMVFWDSKEEGNCTAIKRLGRESGSGKPIEIIVRACHG